MENLAYQVECGAGVGEHTGVEGQDGKAADTG